MTISYVAQLQQNWDAFFRSSIFHTKKGKYAGLPLNRKNHKHLRQQCDKKFLIIQFGLILPQN
jgi:hypothetical protein